MSTVFLNEKNKKMSTVRIYRQDQLLTEEKGKKQTSTDRDDSKQKK